MAKDINYSDPLTSRYIDSSMKKIFSDDFKFSTWRKCWIALAESQQELGIKQVTHEMIAELEKSKDTINFDIALEKEREIRHDVMAHVYAYGIQCPNAKGIIHLGATSQFVVCNTDLLQIKEGLKIIKGQLISVISNLSKQAKETKDMPTLGFTHLQPAQPTTVGKRLTLYINDLIMDLETLENTEKLIQARGAKGTTGTQASYMELFDNDFEKVKKLDKLVSQKLGFDSTFKVTGQTYSRKIDSMVSKLLSSISESAHKFAVDLRLMSHMKIVDEPFEKNQTGSSAMAYKRNPMRSERMTALCRKAINTQMDFSHTHANQWLERSLDDSSIRRISIAQMFFLTNAVLKLYQNITKGMVFYPGQMKKQLDNETQFMATEKILMHLSSKGHDRQQMHEIIKKHSVDTAKDMKLNGSDNDLFERLRSDSDFPIEKEFLDKMSSNPEQFCGAASLQTKEFLDEVVKPILEKSDLDESQTGSEINC